MWVRLHAATFPCAAEAADVAAQSPSRTSDKRGIRGNTMFLVVEFGAAAPAGWVGPPRLAHWLWSNTAHHDHTSDGLLLSAPLRCPGKHFLHAPGHGLRHACLRRERKMWRRKRTGRGHPRSGWRVGAWWCVPAHPSRFPARIEASKRRRRVRGVRGLDEGPPAPRLLQRLSASRARQDVVRGISRRLRRMTGRPFHRGSRGLDHPV